LTTDQRGFASIIQSEATECLSEEQVLLNATVKTVTYSKDGVSVSLSDGSSLSADYALVTFSLGVLQHDDVVFDPPLPKWKSEAIHGMAMVCALVRPPSACFRLIKTHTGNIHKDIFAVPGEVLVRH
jgi:polyamine oxidase